MYLQELIEDRSKQAGALLYPSDSSESYIIVRRAGTAAHRAAEARIGAKYPAIELLSKDKRAEQVTEKAIDMVREFFVVDMVGFKDTETDEYINYQKQKAQIFSGDNCIGLVNMVLSFANDYRNYSEKRSHEFKQALEKYINVNIIEEADDQDWLALWHSVGDEEYKNIRGELTLEQSAMLHVYFDLKRDARGELITRPQVCEAALSVDYDFDDTVDILLHIDDYYTKRQNEKLAAKAEAQQKAKR